ncbi:MAG: hypothetical protein NT028_14330 [candidate division Zixibacteria bacterium]|nr:hypothetical protein [candidate division Zixibacteria bacterium]
MAIYIFLQAIETPNVKKYIIVGGLIAYATFARAVSQLFPLIPIAAVIFTPARYFSVSKRTLLKYTIASAVISFILISLWAVRNYIVNDTPAIAGPGAACLYLGARVESVRSGSLPIYKCGAIFSQEAEKGKNGKATIKEKNDWYFRKLISLFMENPKGFIRIYGVVIGDFLSCQFYSAITWTNQSTTDRR